LEFQTQFEGTKPFGCKVSSKEGTFGSGLELSNKAATKATGATKGVTRIAPTFNGAGAKKSQLSADVNIPDTAFPTALNGFFIS
jgi:hypothetical protein